MKSDQGRPDLQSYAGVVGREKIEELRLLAAPLKGALVQHINSTLMGGGVAEILSRLVPLLGELGLDARWEVLDGTPAFFRVTKAMHNALHGAPEEITRGMVATFREVNRDNFSKLRPEADFVAIHDPQPAGLVEARARAPKSRWVWRCHIDLSESDWGAWAMVRPYVEQFDAAIFHLADYAKELPCPQLVIPPAIDPLSEKNVELAPEEVRQVLAHFHIDPARPLIVQVSRFDWLKDPVGVVQAYRIARRWHDCQLVLAGGGAADDPEGERVLARVREEVGGDPDVFILDLPADSHRVINALQRGATIIVQKSVKEGFGLVVTEAMWKGKPVIGGNVGGIRRQIVHGATGFLVNTPEGAAFRIRQLLANPGLARRIGEGAREYVRENFLLPGYLEKWLLVLHHLRHGTAPVVDLAR